MKRTLRFEPGDTKKFALLFVGFIAGGNAIYKTGERSRDVRAREAQILRALKAISTEKGDAGDRELLKSGGDVVLDQKQHETLMKYLETAPFTTNESDRVDELLDWVSAAPSQEKV